MSDRGSANTLKTALAWLGIGVGLTQLIRPEPYNDLLGTDDHDTLMRVHGMRGIVLGAGALLARDPTPWIWGRVAGDVMDITTVATCYRREGAKQNALLTGLALLAGVTLLDVLCAQSLRHPARRPTPIWRNYATRSGFPRGLPQSRGAAKDFRVPKDMRIPDALRPWTQPANIDEATRSTVEAAGAVS